MKKTVNGHFLFRLQYNCPVFPSNIQDRRCSGQRFFDILILFCGDDLFSPSKLSHGRLPKYLIERRTFRTNRNDPYACVRTDSKKTPSVQAVFQVAPTPISSRFLCPSPPLLLSAPNQNRHATQAKSQIVRRPLQSFIPCLISLLVNVKLKPEIISHGDRQLIVNTTILETWPLEES